MGEILRSECVPGLCRQSLGRSIPSPKVMSSVPSIHNKHIAKHLPTGTFTPLLNGYLVSLTFATTSMIKYSQESYTEADLCLTFCLNM
ncbi:unnamed protein product [Arctogadus glacialis]